MQRSGGGLFMAELRERPVRTGLGLVAEYAMFAAGVGLALGLLLTRVPLRMIDGVLGLGLRQRFVDLLARISPG